MMILINEKVEQRLVEVIRDSNLTKTKFAETLGVSPSSIFDLFNGRTKRISNTIMTVLVRKYGVNRVWVETGEGKKYQGTIIISDPEEIDLIELSRSLSSDNMELLKIVSNTLLKSQNEKQKGSNSKKG